MKKFLIPTFSKIKVKDSKDSNTQRFIVEKLDRGFAQTLGTSMRRTLLSSVPGASAFAVEIKGVKHEFEAIKDTTEDVAEVILNIKNIVIEVDHNIISDDDVYTFRLLSTKGEVTAGDLEVPAGLSIANPELLIATTSKDKALDLKLYINYSKGFRTFEENRATVKDLIGGKIGLIPIDSNYSPIERVSIKVEDVNPGESIVYERLVINVETKRNIDASAAVAFAGLVLSNYFKVFEDMMDFTAEDYFVEDIIEDEEDSQLQLPIDALNLSVRSINALTTAGIDTVGKLMDRKVSDLQDVKNLGEKSKMEIIQIVQDMGLAFKS